MEDKKKISVVFSFRNEADIIPELIRRVAGVLEGERVEYELIFVNDASTDSSLAVLRAARQVNPRVKIVNMSRRFGVSECTIAGLELASGDAAIWMDTDLQDPPEVIPRMIEEWRKGAEVVHTVRTKRHGESPVKMLITRLAYRAIGAAAEIKLPVNAGDFKLMGRKALQHLLKMEEIDPYLRGLAVWVGFPQGYVQYERQARASGDTHFPLLLSRQPAKAFFGGLTSFSLGPIYAIGALALLVLVLSGMAFVAWLVALATGARELFWLGWLVLIGLAWGTLLGAIGMVGVYVGRTYKNVRGRPRYIVQDTEGF